MQTNAYLFGAALLLAVPTTITLVNEHTTFTEFDSIPRLFPGFTEANIQHVILTKASAEAATGAGGEEQGPALEKLVLSRQDDGWAIGQLPQYRAELAGVPIRAQQVETNILDHVKAIRRDERALVLADTTDEEMQERGLTVETGILVECLNAEGQPVVEFYRGNDARGGEYGEDRVSGYFVARKGRKDVILYEPSNQFWDLETDPTNWIDNTIHEFETEDVKSFSFRNPTGDVSFARVGEGESPKSWKLESVIEGVGAVKQAEIDRLLSRFNRVVCARYLGHVQKPELQGKVPTEKNAEYVVTATLEDGSTYAMWVGKKIDDKAELYARFVDSKGPRPFLVAIGDWVKSPFEVDSQTLFDPPPEAIGVPVKEDGEAGPGEAGQNEPAPEKKNTAEKSGSTAEKPDK